MPETYFLHIRINDRLTPRHQVLVLHQESGNKYMIEVEGEHGSYDAAVYAVSVIKQKVMDQEDGYDEGYYIPLRSWLLGKERET